MSVFPQNDAPQSLQAIPQPLAFQDPNLFVAQPTVALANAQAVGHLTQLSDQLALEKAQRKAEMAATDYKIALTGHLQDNLPAASAADLAGYGANTAASNAAAAASGTALAATQATAPTVVQTAVTNATNALSGATADAAFAKLPTPQKQALLANATSYGQTAGSFGALIPTPTGAPTPAQVGAVTPNAPGAIPVVPAALAPTGTSFGADPAGIGGTMKKIMDARLIDQYTEPQIIDSYDAKTGITTKNLVRVMKDGSGVYSTTPLGVTKTDTARAVTSASRELVNIAATQTLTNNVVDALAKFNEAYPNAAGYVDTLKRMGQASAAVGASKTADSQLSVIEKGLGGMAEAAPTRNLVTALQNLGQSVSRLDGESAKGLTAILPSVGDLTNPEILQTKLQGVQDYLGSRTKAYGDIGVASAQTARVPGAPVTKPTPAAKASNLPDGTMRIINGQPMQRVTINGVGGWIPAVQAQ